MTAAALAENSIALDMQRSEQAPVIPEIGHDSGCSGGMFNRVGHAVL